MRHKDNQNGARIKEIEAKKTSCTGTLFFFFLMIRRPPNFTLFPYPTLFRFGNVVFWTADFGVQVCEPKQQQPLLLLFKNADEQRVVVKHPETSEEYWIPATKLQDSRPRQ